MTRTQRLVRAAEIVFIIPIEVGGVPHPRNYAMMSPPAASALATLSPVEQLHQIKAMIGHEFEEARRFCEAVHDAEKGGLTLDAAIRFAATTM